MALYIPVLTEHRDAVYLRGQVEGVLSGDNPQPVHNRIDQLDVVARSNALAVRFGSEIEFSFVINPAREGVAADHGIIDDGDLDAHRASLYERVLENANPPSIHLNDMEFYEKGHILDPGDARGNVLRNAHSGVNLDGQDKSIIEVQTTPGTGKQAIERYWRVVRAIARTAGEYGLMANILSTHVSATIATKEYGKLIYLLPFAEEYKPYLALVQHNLNHLQPLQLDAGLDEGYTVLEAFPRSKNAATTVHNNRLELRHPTVGVVDPRVDILAVLSAATTMENAPRTALQATHATSVYNYYHTEDASYTEVASMGMGRLLLVIGVDERTGQLIAPADLTRSSIDQWSEDRMIRFVNHFYPGEGDSLYDNGGVGLRKLIEGLRLVDAKLTISPSHPYYSRMKEGLSGIILSGRRRTLRVDPLIIADSPDLQRERLHTIKQSPRIRKIFGPALPAVVDAAQSMARKDRLVASQMIVVE